MAYNPKILWPGDIVRLTSCPNNAKESSLIVIAFVTQCKCLITDMEDADDEPSAMARMVFLKIIEGPNNNEEFGCYRHRIKKEEV